MIGEFLAAVVFAALITVLIKRRPWERHEEDRLTVEAWFETFSTDSYLPMLRLAEPLDAGFLTMRRGPVEAARYKREQRKILKEYLRVLSRDFHRLHRLATESAIRARNDHDNSSLALLEDKLEFIFAMWSIELRIMLNEIAPCVVNLRPLLASVEELTARTRQITRRRAEYRLS